MGIMKYNYIFDYNTNRKVNIFSNRGKNILAKYLNNMLLGGSSSNDENQEDTIDTKKIIKIIKTWYYNLTLSLEVSGNENVAMKVENPCTEYKCKNFALDLELFDIEYDFMCKVIENLSHLRTPVENIIILGRNVTLGKNESLLKKLTSSEIFKSIENDSNRCNIQITTLNENNDADEISKINITDYITYNNPKLFNKFNKKKYKC